MRNRAPFSQLRPSATLWILAACALFAPGVWAQSPPQQPAPAQPAPGQPAPQQPADQQAPAPPQLAAPAMQQAPAPTAAHPSDKGTPDAEPATSEEDLKHQLEGKTFYLRGGYLENTLHFNDKGMLQGSSPQASHTLSLVEITHVHADKRHVELEGVRYGLHFLGALPSEDQTQAVDKVRLTSRKKPLKITIDREDVIPPKKQKEPKQEKRKPGKSNPSPAPASAQPPGVTTVTTVIQGTATDRHGATVTTTQAQANQALQKALDKVFSPGIDDRMVATLPDYWQLFYKAVASKSEYRPYSSSIYRQSQVDRKARLISVFEPPSNEYAQNNGVAGMAMYHVVVSADGKPMQIAVGRPIGFGLDENAVAAIRNASFEPAIKDGKPVPVVLDLVVQFRIFSKRTAAFSTQASAANSAPPNPPILPGPYTANAPKPQPDTPPQPDTQPQSQSASQPQAAAQPQSQPQTQPQ